MKNKKLFHSDPRPAVILISGLYLQLFTTISTVVMVLVLDRLIDKPNIKGTRPTPGFQTLFESVDYSLPKNKAVVYRFSLHFVSMNFHYGNSNMSNISPWSKLARSDIVCLFIHTTSHHHAPQIIRCRQTTAKLWLGGTVPSTMQLLFKYIDHAKAINSDVVVKTHKSNTPLIQRQNRA